MKKIKYLLTGSLLILSFAQAHAKEYSDHINPDTIFILEDETECEF